MTNAPTPTPVKIWGRISSINVRKVVWTAQELGLPFTRVDAGGAYGIVKTAAYQTLNPNALVPVVEDDGFVLWESNVIVRYWCAKHSPGALYPSDLRERFDAERWMDWQQTTLNPAGRDAFWQLIRNPDGQINQAKVQASIAATEPLFDRLDAHLRDRPWVCGDRLTMADIPLACEVHRWSGLPIERAPRPHLDRWYAQIQARPASRGVLELPLS